MRLLLVTAILLASYNTAWSQEKWVVVDQKGHATVVEPYLKALARPKVPPFDEVAARQAALWRFPAHPLPIRGEFETREAFQKRVDSTMVANQRRNEAVEEMRRDHAFLELLELLSKVANHTAAELAHQRHEKLFVMFPTTAPRYDIDNKHFSALSIPEPRLGEANYGLADMFLDFKTEGFNCSDLELAKKIRAVSDSGNLWAVVELKNAEIHIAKSSETVQRGAMEKAGESLMKSAPEIGVRIIAEYFNPGSTQNVPFVPQEVNRTKTVPKITVRISGETLRNHSLYDARTKTSWIFKQ